MSAAPIPTPRRHHVVAPTMFGQMLQTVQGGYYVLAGLAMAFFLESLLGPTRDEEPRAGMWLIRGVALAAAGVGAALLYSGWFRRGRAVSSGLGMWVALFLLAQGGAGIALGLVPATLLLDTALEGLFLVLWVVIMFNKVGSQIEQTETQGSGVRAQGSEGTRAVG